MIRKNLNQFIQIKFCNFQKKTTKRLKTVHAEVQRLKIQMLLIVSKISYC